MKNTNRTSIVDFMSERAGLIFLALLPAIIWITNPNVLGNTAGDVDTWFYFGHFMSLGHYTGYDYNGAGDYYATRLPYIIPGYIVFHLFSLAWAKAVFAYLCYATTIWAMFYTFRAHMAGRMAALALMLMATDIFFTRAMNWNYVDEGAIVYQALTFAALTAARSSRRKILWTGIAAFSFTCSVFCHLGVSLTILPIACYAWFCLKPATLSKREILELLYAAFGGVAACQIVFGLLNVVLNGGNFFFIALLYKIGKTEAHSLEQWDAPLQLMRNGAWLAVPFALWVATGIALLAAAARMVKLEKFQIAVLLTTFVICSLLYLLDSAHATYFLSRVGMYVSLYLVVVYFGLAALLSRGEALSVPATLAVGTSFLAALLLKLHYNDTGIPGLPPLDGTWVAGLVFGLLLAAAFFLPHKGLKTAILCMAAIPTLFIQWKFDDTRDAYKAFMTLRQMAGNDLPNIWANANDPLYRGVILPTISSFTERGWWARGDKFPNFPPDAWDGGNVFIVSGTLHSLSIAQKLAAPNVDRIVTVTSRMLHLSAGDLWIGEFKVWNKLGYLRTISRKELEQTKTPAAQMDSLLGRVDNGSRIAIEGQEGLLMFGPYMSLVGGKYQITIVYGPSTQKQTWDICKNVDGRATRILWGDLPATNKKDAQVVIPLSLTGMAKGVEIRARYSGSGQFAVHFVGVKPLTTH